MGRGDRRKVRWAHDRERKKKEREARMVAELTKSRKGTKTKKR
ncbi:MAG TPA: hypothetical protein VE915_00785 [Actinomycetota bacterium]|nr:hypothetical protein [Actinomycetota bacterium]